MIATSDSFEENYKTIDTTYDPKISRWTRFQYWKTFVERHYFYGRKAGLYGPEKIALKMKAIEKEIERQAKQGGEAPWIDLPEVDGQKISPETFQKIYLRSNTPVVMRGMAKKSKACRTWSLDSFKEKYGDNIVPTRLRGNQLEEEALKYVDITLSELIDNIRKGGYYFSGHVEDIFNQNPHLRDEIDVKFLQKYLCKGNLSKIMSTQTFISGPGTRSGFHCTGVPNLFIMVEGTKDWSFVHPKHSMFMTPAARKDMFYSMSAVEWLKSNEEIAADGFPLFNYIPKYRVTLQPGDVLFSPQWWWHAVNTTSPSIGVATRCVNKLVLGHTIFSYMWITSKEFRRLAFNVLKTGWGSDRHSGAKLAFEKEFIEGVGV